MGLKKQPITCFKSNFWVNIRSEIINVLEHDNGIAIQRLSKDIGYAYSGVYREVESLVINGFIVENAGKAGF